MAVAWHLFVYLLLELVTCTESRLQEGPGLAMGLLQERHTNVAEEMNAVTRDAEVWH